MSQYPKFPRLNAQNFLKASDFILILKIFAKILNVTYSQLHTIVIRYYLNFFHQYREYAPN